ncbi:MAG: transcriptional regulator [Pseudolabrys sp.]
MDDLLIRVRAALKRAKDGVGGASGLSRALGGKPTPQAISQWDRVPAGRVLQVEAATGVSCHELRPDLYPARSLVKRTHASRTPARREKVLAR